MTSPSSRRNQYLGSDPKRAAERGASALVAVPEAGRTFSTTRRVSIDDCDSHGRMEFDAIARFLQDVGNDDTDDAGFAELGLAWVARRSVIDVGATPKARELVTVTTWASGTGRCWAERRTTITSESGARIDAATIWIHLDPTTARPTPWGDEFARVYLPATQGRKVDSRLRLPKKPDSETPTTQNIWTFRKTDCDSFGHVNNTAYLAAAEQFLDLIQPCSITIEWRSPTGSHDVLVALVSSGQTNGEQALWLIDQQTAESRAVMSVLPTIDSNR